MSMFDTVNFRCPQCGELIQEQTKSGPCELKDYDAGMVDIRAAAGMQGDRIECGGCGSEFRIAGLPTHVPLFLVSSQAYSAALGEDEEY